MYAYVLLAEHSGTHSIYSITAVYVLLSWATTNTQAEQKQTFNANYKNVTILTHYDITKINGSAVA